MATMNRTQTDIQSSNRGMASIKNQSFNHQVAPIASAQSGLDPFRGDLTNAFNNFFGSVQNSMQNFQEAEMINKKVEAQTYADNMKKEAKALATDQYMENGSMKASGIDGMIGGLSPEQQSNRHFLTTYKDTLGANIGDRMYGDFALHMSQKPASSFDSEALSWWEKEYGDGTGDETVDVSMQAAWARNFEVARVKASGETIKQQKQQTLNELNNDIFRRVASPNFSDVDWASMVSNTASLYPNETIGQHNARTLGMMMNASVAAGPAKTQKFLAFLDHANEGQQSYAERFPAAVAKIKAETYDALVANTTLSGQEAYTTAASKFAAITNEPDEFTQVEQLTTFYATEIPKLMNTPGASYSQIQALKAKAAEQFSVLKEYTLKVNGITQGAQTGDWGSLETADLTKYGHEAIMRRADWFNIEPGEDPTKVMFTASTTIKGMMDRFGEKAISDDTKQLFTAGLLSNDPALQGRTATVLRAIDGTGDLGRLLVAHDPRAATIYDAAVAPMVANQSVDQSLLVVNSEEFKVASQQVADTGVAQMLYPEEKKDDATKQFAADFFGEDMSEFIEEEMGMDDGWLFFGNAGSPNISPIVQKQIKALANTQMSKLRALGQDYDVDTLRKNIYRTLAPALYIDNGVIKMNSGTQAISDREGSIVPLGNTIYNPNTGKHENTAETLREDIGYIQEGLLGIYIDGEEVPEDGNNYYEVVRSDNLKHLNAYQVISTTTGVPLTIGIGNEYEVNESFTYDKEGNLSEKGWFKDWWDDTEKISFTGDPEMDAMKASLVFGKGVALVPVTNASGDVLTYNVVVRPRFKEGASKYSIETIEKNANDTSFNAVPVVDKLTGDSMIMP